MDSSCFTMPYLESLSTGELIDLAEKCGLDIPHGLERVFIIEELLYFNENNDDKTGETENLNPREFKELAALPKHYNISYIDVLIRDPLWAFVFWEIKGQNREMYQQTADFTAYCLRVISLKGESLQPDIAASFTVMISAADSAWYVGFPPDDGRCYKIELCVMCGDSYTVLAESRTFILPRLIQAHENTDGNPLMQLSGVDRFSLAHSEDRLLRSRGI